MKRKNSVLKLVDDLYVMLAISGKILRPYTDTLGFIVNALIILSSLFSFFSTTQNKWKLAGFGYSIAVAQ